MYLMRWLKIVLCVCFIKELHWEFSLLCYRVIMCYCVICYFFFTYFKISILLRVNVIDILYNTVNILEPS